ncbi:IS110 family transposase [Catenovulum sp. 2E275]|uniref:IS110 family transposase n=1 Tax=Catenovulum sp. 2E275 TaxID=2980497 RepID=UPI0021D04A57|nr:IS110 family transposase [Catenovulum sp. 2E275]MCU4677714.1 IS110 family transposase [Catenovulum sp. 2E275]
MHNTVIGVDLATKAIQVCVYINKKVRSNIELTPQQFTEFLVQQSPSLIVFESCSGSNYWVQFCRSVGHEAKLISTRLVMAVRQNQKTDKNDALAIVQASLLPDIHFVSSKTTHQQQAQSILRLREQCIKQKTALKNQLGGLLREFNITVGRGECKLICAIESALEDAENGLHVTFRSMLHQSLILYQQICLALESYNHALEEWVNNTPDCKKLMKIEGIGFLNAINLYIKIAEQDYSEFKQGRDVAACIGVTPVQHSSGGKVKIGSIGKRKNTGIRSLLITGAMAVIQQLEKREPRTQKENWLKALMVRRGKKCAAVALANKNVRTAFSMLKNGTEYRSI